jgi:hypothetical protein
MSANEPLVPVELTVAEVDGQLVELPVAEPVAAPRGLFAALAAEAVAFAAKLFLAAGGVAIGAVVALFALLALTLLAPVVALGLCWAAWRWHRAHGGPGLAGAA